MHLASEDLNSNPCFITYYHLLTVSLSLSVLRYEMGMVIMTYFTELW